MAPARVDTPIIGDDVGERRLRRYEQQCWARHIEGSSGLVSNRHFHDGDPPSVLGDQDHAGAQSHDPHYGDTLLWQGIALATWALEYERSGSPRTHARMRAIFDALRRLEVDHAGRPAGGKSGYLVRTDRGPEAPPDPHSNPSGSNYTGAMLGMTLAHHVLARTRPDPGMAAEIAGLMLRIGRHFERFGYFGFTPGAFDGSGDRERRYKRDDQLDCENKSYEPAKGIVMRGPFATLMFEHSFRRMILEVTGQDLPSREGNLFKRIRYKEGRQYWDPAGLAPFPIVTHCVSSRYVRHKYLRALERWAKALVPRVLTMIPAILGQALGAGVSVGAFVDAVGRSDPSLVLALGLTPERIIVTELGSMLLAGAYDALVFQGLRQRFADDFQRPNGDTQTITDIVIGQLIKAAIPDARQRFAALLRLEHLALVHLPSHVLEGGYDDLHVLFMNCVYGVSDRGLLDQYRALYEEVKRIPGDRNPALALITEIIARRLGAQHEPWVRDAWARESLDQLQLFPVGHLPNTWYHPPSGRPAFRQDYAWSRAPADRLEPHCAGHGEAASCNVEAPGLDYMFPYELMHHLGLAPGRDQARYDRPASCPATISVAPGERRRLQLTFANTGTSTWRPEAYKLGAVGDADGDAHRFLVGAGGDPNRVWLDREVRPSGSHTFSFEVVAPVAGTYRPRFQMVHEGAGWFGELTPEVEVRVIDGHVGRDDADVTLDPGGTTIRLQPGQSMRLAIRAHNTGDTVWSRDSQVKLGAVGDEGGDAHRLLVGAGGDPNRVWLPEDVEVWPEQTHTFDFTIVAPPEPRTYHPRFRMVRDGSADGWFGAESHPPLTVEVR